MTSMGVSHLTSKAAAADDPRLGPCVVAVEPIITGEVVAVFGGRCVTYDEFVHLPTHQRARSLQVEDGVFLAAAADPEPSDFVNHSCDPNCGLRGSTVIVAMRDICPGEALTFDYACSNASEVTGFDCTCGSPSCRGTVTGHDWTNPELQRRYRGYFSPYLAVRIAALAAVHAGRRAFAY